MKLLIVTQKVDRQDPVLGFFHAWIAAFAAKTDHVTVIAQHVGEHDLPANVTILSLEKEKGKSTLGQIVRFKSLIWKHRDDYDTVLVHMTPVWMVIGGPMWMLLNKSRYLWYESRGMRWPLRVALHMVKKVFSASAYGMPLQTRKSIVTGHGIDTDLFSPDESQRVANRLLSVGRITAGKSPGRVIRLLLGLPEGCHLQWVGGPVTEDDRKLEQALQRDIDVLRLRQRVSFRTVPHDRLAQLMQEADVFVHASVTGLDKAVLEAMACGCIAVSVSPALADILPKALQCTPETMGQTVASVLVLPASEKEALRKTLREAVIRHHGLDRLIALLVAHMQTMKN